MILAMLALRACACGIAAPVEQGLVLGCLDRRRSGRFFVSSTKDEFYSSDLPKERRSCGAVHRDQCRTEDRLTPSNLGGNPIVVRKTGAARWWARPARALLGERYQL